MEKSKSKQGDEAPLSEREERMQVIVKAFRLVFRAVQEHSRWVEKQCGVSAAQLWAMWELMENPGMRVSELSENMSIHQSTTSNMLDKLEKRGLLKRERRGPDHRVVQLYLTDAGAALVAESPRPAQGALNYAVSRLPDHVVESLGENLELLLSLMKVTDTTSALEPLSENQDR